MPKTYTPAAPFNDPAEHLDIPLSPVESKQVKAIGYDAATRTLAVTFTRGPGTEYQYPNVEPETHAAFIAAESIGTYFGQYIKPLSFKKFEPPQAVAA